MGPQWPRLYPSAVASEYEARKRGECSRTLEVRGGLVHLPPAAWLTPRLRLACLQPVQGFKRMSGNMLASVGEMGSWLKVYNKDKVKEEVR